MGPVVWALQRVPEVKRVKRTIIKNDLNGLKIYKFALFITYSFNSNKHKIFTKQNEIHQYCLYVIYNNAQSSSMGSLFKSLLN